MEIKEKIGLGDLKFGMSSEDAKGILGEPDEIESYSYEDEDNESEEDEIDSEIWHYDDLNISLNFSEIGESSLISISVTAGNYEFRGLNLIGISESYFLSQMEKIGITDVTKEEMVLDDEDEEDDAEQEENKNQIPETFYASNSLVMTFWFDEGMLAEIQWSPEL